MTKHPDAQLEAARRQGAEEFRERAKIELRRMADTERGEGFRCQGNGDLIAGRSAFSKAFAFERASVIIAALPLEESEADNPPRSE